MSHDYERLPDPGEGLRLHLNENTAGCSPRVLDALRRVTAEQVAFYPDYTAATGACAEHLGVAADHVLLTNGLDEGILAVAIAALRGDATGAGDAIVVEPAFDMYAACVDAAGGRVVPVAPRPDLGFPLEEIACALTPATRLVFACNPNNPTGKTVDCEVLSRLAGRLPSGAKLFVDEAYAGFGAPSFCDELENHPNVVVGRTFAKGHGLAALRVGCLVAVPETLAPICRVVPPYSVNVFAVVGLRAALEDRTYHAWYVSQVAASKRLIYEMCDRLGLQYWPSAANFVLIRLGDRAGALVTQLAGRRIFIRDRSGEPGCGGSVRVTAGIVEHTRACVDAMEELLCGAR